MVHQEFESVRSLRDPSDPVVSDDPGTGKCERLRHPEPTGDFHVEIVQGPTTTKTTKPLM